MNNLKKILTATAFVAFGLILHPLQAAPSSQSDIDLSYAIGFEMGKSFKDNDIQINSTYFSKGIQEGLSETQTPYLSEDKIAKVLKRFRDTSITQKQKALNALAKENLKTGKAFLKNNANKLGVVLLQGGLEYKILESSSAETPQKPTRSDTVVVDYVGRHLDGKVFDQGTQSNFKVSNVIAGLQQIFPMMKVGDRWKVYIPSHLAYGPEGAPDIIGPNETLVYEIHLTKVKREA
jgi:FKBP-type peptidyl-prolyl cis-trans isomerase FklB